MKKKLSILFLCVAAVLLLVSCRHGEDTTAREETIRIIYPISRGMGEKDIAGLQEWFASNYPNAKLELVSASVTTITDTAKSELKNGKGADVFVTTDYDTFLDEGLLANLTEMEAVHWFRKSSTKELERYGELYALPIGGGNMMALHYNKELFDRYNLAPPQSAETFSQLIERVQAVIDENELRQVAVNASMLYPSQVSLIYNSIFAEQTQSTDYLKWGLHYQDNSFQDPVFQNYLAGIATTMEEDEELFDSGDFENSISSSIEKFLDGKSFLFLGDVKRCYDTIMSSDAYDINTIGVVGIPSGIDGVSYVSYMDDLYIGVNRRYKSYSPEKQQIIRDLLNYVASGDSEIRNIFTFTGAYSSVYLEGEGIETIDDPYFAQINDCLAHNYVEQGINNSSYSTVLGKTLTAWRKGRLDKYIESDGSDMEKVTTILEEYKNGNNVYAKSEEVIGNSSVMMEYQSNLVRSQETAIGNQVADMAKDYMGTDFAVINAGGIRASIPDGNISIQTLDSVLPYTNYLIKIKVSGATLKQALANGYNVGPGYKAGKFAEISGLKVVLKTKAEGFAQYQTLLDQWTGEHPNADKLELNEAQSQIVQQVCANDSEALNLDLISVTDSNGNEIQDDQMYTVATVDYLLKDQDGYSMLGILGDNPQADPTIEIYDENDNRIQGSADEMQKQIEATCKTGAEGFVAWMQSGNSLNAKVDGRIQIDDFIYIQQN